MRRLFFLSTYILMNPISCKRVVSDQPEVHPSLKKHHGEVAQPSVEVRSISSFEGVTTKLQNRDIGICSESLEEDNRFFSQLSEEERANILRGVNPDDNRSAIKLDTYFKKSEYLTKIGGVTYALGDFLAFLDANEKMGTLFNENVFTRAIEGLIYALNKLPCKPGSSEILLLLYDKLWEKIDNFEGSTIRLEKLTRAFGIALHALSAHYHAGCIVKPSRTEKKEGTKLDRKAEIWKKANELKTRIRDKKLPIHLAIEYNLDFIEEGAKRLTTTSSGSKHKAESVAKGVGRVVKSAISPLSGGLGGGEIDGEKLCEFPVVVYQEVAKLVTDPSFRRRRRWAEQVGDESGKSAEITLETYRQHVQKREEAWQWDYALIGYRKDIIKYSAENALKEQAKDDLIAYVTGDATWNQMNEKVKIRLYQVFYELTKSSTDPTFGSFLESIKRRDPGLEAKAQSSIQLVEQEMECTDYWNKIEGVQKEESKKKDSTEQITNMEETRRCVEAFLRVENKPAVSIAEMDEVTPPTTVGVQVIPTSAKKIRVLISCDPSVEEGPFLTNLKEQLEQAGDADCPVKFKQGPQFFKQWVPDYNAFIMKEPDLIILYLTKEYFKMESGIDQLIEAEETLDKNKLHEKMRVIFDEEMRSLVKNREKKKSFLNEIATHWCRQYEAGRKVFEDEKVAIEVKLAIVKEVHYLYRQGLAVIKFLQEITSMLPATENTLREDIGKLMKVKKRAAPKSALLKEYIEPVANFIGREEELQELDKIAPPVEEENEKTKIIVLWGLGGVGKTQLARKFVAKNHQNYTMVYTLDGQSEETINQGYKNLVFRLSGIDMTERSPAEVRKRVNALLAQQDNKGWLLLFDNADESDMLDSLYDKLPKRGGNIVITSRVVLDWENVAVIEVNQFKRTDSISLLEKIIRKDRQCDHETLDALAEALGDLPLALTQAGAYINSFKRKGYNAAEYLTAFQKSYADSAARLAEFRSTVECHNRRIITTTWDMSRENIIVRCPLADEALCLLAYLNPKKIPSDWIDRWLQNRGIQDEEELKEKVSEIINTLYEGYSMIHYEEEEGISIHRLMQRVVQGSLPEEERKKFIGEALRLEKDKFNPYNHGDPKTWKIGRECLPHAISVANRASRHYPDFNELENSEREIPKQMGVFFHAMGNYVMRQGNASQAIEYYEKALEIFKSFYGENHPSVASTLGNLGNARSALGEKKRAIEYYEKVLEITKSFHGAHHPSVADTLNNLGLAWSDLGENKKAVEYYEKALEILKSFYGAHHPSVADTLSNLGLAWSALGEKKKAIEYYEKALEMTKAFLGESHSSVADILNNLGLAWSALGEKKKAIEYYEKALEMKKSFYGTHHPSVAGILNNLGTAWSDLGEKKKAIEYYEKALEMTKAVFGAHHPSVADTLHNLGTAWSDLGEKKKAIEYYEKALEMKKSFYGSHHPSVASTLNNLGTAWSDLGEKKKAIEYYEKALEVTKSFYGTHHPSVADILNNLGNAWNDLGEKKKAIEYYEKALEMTKAFFGTHHPSVAGTLNNLGAAWSDLGEKKKAIEYYEKALEMTKAVFGTHHPLVADTLNNLGIAWSDLGEKKKAIEYYEKALEITKAVFGAHHPSVADTLNNLGNAWYKLGEREKAIEYLEQAYTMNQQFLGESHPNTRTIKSNLDYCKGNESSMDLNTLLMLLRALSNKEEEETPDDTTAETPDQNERLRQILTGVLSALSEADGDQSEPTEPSSPQCSPQ